MGWLENMHVLNVVSVISAREGGGNAERTVRLSQVFTESGATCTVVALDIGDSRARSEELAGAKLVLVPCLIRRFQVPWPHWRTIRELVRQSDVIHLMGFWSLLGVMVFIAARALRVPYVISPAGALPVFGRSRWLKRIFNLVVGRRMVVQADGWIAITRAEVVDFVGYGVKSERVTVIPNGIQESDQDLYLKKDIGIAEQIPSKPYVLFMGRLNPIKGPDLLLDAFGIVAKEFPDVSLVFAGPDEGMQSDLEQRSVVMDICARVHFVGFVSGTRKRDMYRHAELLVVPSRLEAMSIVAVEAGACGTPVLMTDQCGLDELREVEPGLVVRASVSGLATGLRFALSNLTRRVAWGKRWQSLVTERFRWTDLGRQLLAKLELIARNRS